VSAPQPPEDRILLAKLHGEVMHHARWEPSDEATTQAAVEGLRELVAGREDGPALLAETAGILTGFHEGDLGEARARNGAAFCVAAGADESLIPEWVEEGRRRAARARMPPPSGGLHGGGVPRP
jgi:hypothetical protein